MALAQSRRDGDVCTRDCEFPSSLSFEPCRVGLQREDQGARNSLRLRSSSRGYFLRFTRIMRLLSLSRRELTRLACFSSIRPSGFAKGNRAVAYSRPTDKRVYIQRLCVYAF